MTLHTTMMQTMQPQGSSTCLFMWMTQNYLSGRAALWRRLPTEAFLSGIQKGIRTIEPTTISNGLDDIYEDGYYAGLQSGWQDMYASYNISLTKDYERGLQRSRKQPLCLKIWWM